MPFISQNILPHSNHTEQISVQHFTSRTIKCFLTALGKLTAAHVGVSLRLYADGHVAAIAFATISEALYLTIEAPLFVADRTGIIGANLGPKYSKKVGLPDIIIKIVTSIEKTLVGFSMARLALHLVREFGWHINGVDLSSLLTSSREKLLTPSDFLYKKVYDRVNRRHVDSLWYPDTDDETTMSRVCQRAWISAVSVIILRLFHIMW
jgi:hypothetical protein